MKGFVLSVLAIGALVAWMAPRSPVPAEPNHADARAEVQLQAAAQPDWYGGEMVLPRAADGHFYASVRVDTRDYRMLVDTGASVVALTGDDARDIGLHWAPNELAPVARGASGPVMGVPVVLEHVAVGDFEARGVQAVIVPDGLAVSLLGQSFLQSIERVEISDDALTLAD